MYNNKYIKTTMKIYNIRKYVNLQGNTIPENNGHSLHEKSYFFPNALKRWYFEKDSTGIWPFLYYQERWYFIFPKISSYSLDGKWKMMIQKKKNSWKYDIFLKCSGNIVFPKKSHWNIIFPLLSGKMFFSSDGKWKVICLKKYIEIWYFLYICINLTNMVLPFCKKTKTKNIK